MNAKEYKLRTGLEPIQDDLERVNCQQAGLIGHNNCGWCELHDKPRFNCMCMTYSKKWVYGTRTNMWYLVDNTDRDYEIGITQEEMSRIGFELAKIKYLSSSVV